MTTPTQTTWNLQPINFNTWTVPTDTSTPLFFVNVPISDDILFSRVAGWENIRNNGKTYYIASEELLEWLQLGALEYSLDSTTNVLTLTLIEPDSDGLMEKLIGNRTANLSINRRELGILQRQRTLITDTTMRAAIDNEILNCHNEILYNEMYALITKSLDLQANRKALTRKFDTFEANTTSRASQFSTHFFPRTETDDKLHKHQAAVASGFSSVQDAVSKAYQVINFLKANPTRVPLKMSRSQMNSIITDGLAAS